jgi:cytochrome c-type biogenesis protein CcmH/NrfG
MKAWWLNKGWPWLKSNWWVLLILPLMALVAVGIWIWNRKQEVPVPIDVLKPADDRAQVEAATRTKELEAEKIRLQQELTDITVKHDTLQSQFEERLQGEVDALRNDPERLRELMLSVGQGGKP